MQKHDSRNSIFSLLIVTILIIGNSCQGQDSTVFVYPVFTEDTTPSFPTIAPSSTSESTSENIVRLAWFYKPPEDEQFQTVAEYFNLFILTHKDEDAREQLKAMGVDSIFFQYLTLIEIYAPESCDDNPYGNQIAYKEGDFCEISQNHPDWFLLDTQGNRVHPGGDRDWYYMDPGNQEYREFFLNRAQEMQKQFGWDGLFLDNVEASLNKFYEDGILLARYNSEQKFQLAISDFLSYLYANYSQPKALPLMANIVSLNDSKIWLEYLKHLDGTMIEDFAVDWSDGYLSHQEWEAQMTLIEAALASGKELILVSQGSQDDLLRQQFALASYLLVSNGRTAFRYADAHEYEGVWIYNNYSENLGAPLGPRYKEGATWHRDFENGTITVNPSKHSSDINLFP